MQRPLSVTIIAWILIVTSVFGLLSTLLMGDNPIVQSMFEQSRFSQQAHMAVAVIGGLITIVCGYGLLKGTIGRASSMSAGTPSQ